MKAIKQLARILVYGAFWLLFAYAGTRAKGWEAGLCWLGGVVMASKAFTAFEELTA